MIFLEADLINFRCPIIPDSGKIKSGDIGFNLNGKPFKLTFANVTYNNGAIIVGLNDEWKNTINSI